LASLPHPTRPITWCQGSTTFVKSHLVSVTDMSLIYNGTSPTGGDSLTEDLNIYYESGDIAWMIMATALVLLMIPGVGYVFTSTLSQHAHNLQLLLLRTRTPEI